MEKVVKKLSSKDEDPIYEYWASRTTEQRWANLERIRAEVIKEKYGSDPGFQRVVSIVKREGS